MKKTLFTLLLLAVVTILSAQSLQFECDGTYYQDGETIISTYNETYGEYLQEMRIKNLTGNDVSVIIEREILEDADGAVSYFCWGLCLSPTVNVSPEVMVAAQSLSDEEFSAHVMFTEGETGVVKAKYSAYLRSNPDDRTSIIILAGASANVSEYSFNLGQAYPNPANTQVHFNFSANDNSNVSAVVYNLLGQEVKVQSVNGTQGRIDFDVEDLQAGIYFCSIKVDNTAVKTEKFIVKR